MYFLIFTKHLSYRFCTKKYFASVNPHNDLATQLVRLRYFAVEMSTPGPDKFKPQAPA